MIKLNSESPRPVVDVLPILILKSHGRKYTDV